MRTRSIWIGPVFGLALALSVACGGRGTDTGKGTVGAPQSVADARQGPLTAREQQIFHHLAEGSELIPVAWVRAMRNPDDRSKFFLQNPERFGLITDPGNPDGLPIGVTADTTVDLRFFGVMMMGFNCSACHTNQITYQGNRLLIDGAPGRFNAELIGTDIGRALKETLKPLHFLQFVYDLARQHPSVFGTDSVRLRHTRHPAVVRWLGDLVDAEVTQAEERFLAALHDELGRDSARSPAVNLKSVPWDSTHPAFQQLMRRYADLRTEGARTALHAALPPDSAMGADARVAAAREGAVGELMVLWRMLRDRVELLRADAGHSTVADTPDGPARVDAFGVARNRLYARDSVPTTAPVSYPHLWGFGDVTWLHYDANTTSVMERNLGQALGVGGVFDPVTLKSTLNPINIHQLELLARRLQAPSWPAFFPAIDPAKAQRGEPLFGQYCAGCHQQALDTMDVCFPVSGMWTDSLRAVNFAKPLGNGRFTDSVAPLLRGMKYAAYETFRIPRNQWDTYNGIPDDRVVWRVTGQYGVRTLAGAWATAPYLHNGSVPSLYELLLPASRRSRTFPLGHPEYDPVRVGYSMTAPAGTYRFDTSLAGNANTGHEFGTSLSEEERMALLEYLKTLDADTRPAPRQPQGGRCPNLNGPVRR